MSVSAERHPITSAIDGTNNWWQSPSIQNGRQFHWVTITLDLRQVRRKKQSFLHDMWWWRNSNEESQCNLLFRPAMRRTYFVPRDMTLCNSLLYRTVIVHSCRIFETGIDGSLNPKWIRGFVEVQIGLYSIVHNDGPGWWTRWPYTCMSFISSGYFNVLKASVLSLSRHIFSVFQQLLRTLYIMLNIMLVTLGCSEM